MTKPGILGVTGSNDTQARLLAYLRAGRVHQSLLLTGPDREVKFQVAKRLAQVMLCRSPKPPAPFCGTCSACRRIEKDIHPDVVIHREPDEDQIKIDVIRQLCHQMEVGPAEGGAKILIIDEFHRINDSAENAMLKTLEEPLPNRHFWLLTTQPGSLLATTRSRCIGFIFRPDSELGESAETAAEYLRLFDEALSSGSAAALVAAVDKDKGRCLGFLRFLQMQLRAAAVGAGAVSSFRRLSVESALVKFDEALTLEGRLRSNANYGLMLETFMRREFLT